MSDKRIPQKVLVPISNPVGGIRTYLLNNLQFLVKSGYEFTFLAPASIGFEDFKNDVRQWPGVEFVDVPVRGGKFSLRKAVRAALGQRRFALIHSQGLRAGTEAAIANFRARVPHLFTLHDTINPHNKIPGRFRWLKTRIIGQFTKRVDVIVAVSQDCADNYVQHFPEWKHGRCRIEVIRNGVDIERLLSGVDSDSSNASLRQHLGISEDIILAGFFGRFMPEKGFLELLEALRILAQRGFADRIRLIATRDPHGYRGQYMREVANDAALSKMVRFIEPVPNIAPLLAQMDMLITPSLWEACPLLPMEAMVLGVQVIGSNAIGLREVLRDTPSAMPDAGDHQALARAIEAAVTCSEKDDSRLFIPIARQQFSNVTALESLRRLYDQLGSHLMTTKSDAGAI